jgi:hypothetical protein
LTMLGSNFLMTQRSNFLTEKNGRRLFISTQLTASRVRPSNYATYDLTCGPHLSETWLKR